MSNFCVKDSSVCRTPVVASSNIVRIPPAPSIKARTSELSGKTMLAMLISSALYSSSSRVNTMLLKKYCNFSLDKFMSNCSKKLVSNDSKPAMSNTPMNCALLSALHPMVLPNAWLHLPTIHLNNNPYIIFAMESRAAMALSLVSGDITVSIPVVIRLKRKHFDMASTCTPKSSAATIKASGVEMLVWPRSAKSMFPMCIMPATVLKMLSSSGVAKSNIVKARRRFCNSFSSSTPGIAMGLALK
mmetsp:Transcript_117361/g.339300  ORF Transcript_117361/g.339300 Transcript_117361/m.339300 type:complete len:244 (+) Transcript_117361:91-822(+)